MKLSLSLLTLGLVCSSALVVHLHRTNRALQSSLLTAETTANENATRAAEADRRTSEVRARLTELDGQLSTARAQLSETETRVAQLNRDAADQRNRVSLAEENARTHEAAADELRRELAHLKLNTPPFTLTEIETLQATLADAEARLAALTPARPVHPEASATVMRVGPENAFVVLDYGSAHGARSGQQLQIRRGTDVVASVQISDLHEQLSLALVMPDTLRSGLRKGDSAPIPSQP
jgi:TolA-binding protein